jgi:hydrogenase-4 membrane subunit HyfE
MFVFWYLIKSIYLYFIKFKLHIYFNVVQYFVQDDSIFIYFYIVIVTLLKNTILTEKKVDTKRKTRLWKEKSQKCFRKIIEIWIKIIIKSLVFNVKKSFKLFIKLNSLENTLKFIFILYFIHLYNFFLKI